MTNTFGPAAIGGNRKGTDIARPRVVTAKAAALLKVFVLGASMLLSTASLSLAQSYDPDLGQGNTAPPGVTYGGGLRYGSGYSGWSPGIWNHHAEFRRQPARHRRHPRAR
jgi:hypothetical protein